MLRLKKNLIKRLFLSGKVLVRMSVRIDGNDWTRRKDTHAHKANLKLK